MFNKIAVGIVGKVGWETQDVTEGEDSNDAVDEPDISRVSSWFFGESDNRCCRHASNLCSSKQKHWFLLKYKPTFGG
jgi:precorrin-4 methylase